MSLQNLIGVVFPRRPGILGDLIARQRDYDDAAWLIEHVRAALGELEQQRAKLADIDPATSGVDPEPKLRRLQVQKTCLIEFLARLERVSEPTEQYIIAELIRAAEQQ